MHKLVGNLILALGTVLILLMFLGIGFISAFLLVNNYFIAGGLTLFIGFTIGLTIMFTLMDIVWPGQRK